MKPVILQSCLFLFCAVCLLSSCAHYQKVYTEPVETAHLEVLDRFGKPVEGAKISVHRNKRKVGMFERTTNCVAEGSTNSEGKKRFQNLIHFDQVSVSSPDQRFYGAVKLDSATNKFQIKLEQHTGFAVTHNGGVIIDEKVAKQHSATVEKLLDYYTENKQVNLGSLEQYIAAGAISKTEAKELLAYIKKTSVVYSWGDGCIVFPSLQDPIKWKNDGGALADLIPSASQ